MTVSEKLYVQFGAGDEQIDGWLNFDASPTLRLQRLPIIGGLFKRGCIFDNEIVFGDIVKGLPLKDSTVDGLFASHVLEHLSYDDGITALKNSFAMLKPGGRLRIIVPDLGFYIQKYSSEGLAATDGSETSGYQFNLKSGLGRLTSRSTIKSRLVSSFGNSSHRWMWDYASLSAELKACGFVDITKFDQGMCDDDMFLAPERDHQFHGQDGAYGLAVECFKP